MLFSDVIKNEMSKRNLTVEDIAECSGLTTVKVRSYTLGTIPNDDDYEKVCEAIGIDPDELVIEKLNISVEECAKTMQKSNEYVKYLVRKGIFGSTNGSSYHIPRRKFEEYMGLRNSNQIDNIINIMFELLKERLKQEKATAGNTVTND